MKNLLKLSFLAGFIFLSVSVMGKDKDFSISFGNVIAKKLNFELLNAKNVSLYVYNDKDGELYSEKVEKSSSVSKSYDLNNFPSGTYYLVAESEYKIEKYKITIDADDASVEKTPVLEIAKPEYTIQGNQVKLYMPKLSEGVNVSVQDFADNVYYDQAKTPTDGELVINFDLDPQTADSYIISVAKGGNVFNKIISLK